MNQQTGTEWRETLADLVGSTDGQAGRVWLSMSPSHQLHVANKVALSFVTAGRKTLAGSTTLAVKSCLWQLSHKLHVTLGPYSGHLAWCLQAR